jgi:hypothetical protein
MPPSVSAIRPASLATPEVIPAANMNSFSGALTQGVSGGRFNYPPKRGGRPLYPMVRHSLTGKHISFPLVFPGRKPNRRFPEKLCRKERDYDLAWVQLLSGTKMWGSLGSELLWWAYIRQLCSYQLLVQFHRLLLRDPESTCSVLGRRHPAEQHLAQQILLWRDGRFSFRQCYEEWLGIQFLISSALEWSLPLTPLS